MIIKNEDVMNDIKTLEDYSQDLIFCDPPYNLSSQWEIGDNGNPIVKGKAIDFMNRWNGLDENSLEEMGTDLE